MDRYWEITPELYDTNWLRMFLGCALIGMFVLGLEYFLDTHHRWLVALLFALSAMAIQFVRVHDRLRYQLHLEADCISARYSSGTLEVIDKNDIFRLHNSRPWDPRGQGLVICSSGGFMRNRTEIFIPAALPDCEFLRQTFTTWQSEQRPRSAPLSL